MKKMIKTKAIFVRSDERYKSKVKGVAGILEKDESNFVRDAINEKIAREAKRNPRVAEFVSKAA